MKDSATANQSALPLLHTLTAAETLIRLKASSQGLTQAEVDRRLAEYGPNRLPQPETPGVVAIFFRQFLSPLIYILLAAAIVSLLLKEWSDATFIFGVLTINAIIGTIQEYSAEKSAAALRSLVATRARVLRDGVSCQIDAEGLVPGDIVSLSPGLRVPADLRLLSGIGMEIDESLLTGESLPTRKHPDSLGTPDTVLGDRTNMAFAGTMAMRGQGEGVVAAIGLETEVGRIAASVLGSSGGKPPLLVRMETFTMRVATLVGIAVVIMAGVSLVRGAPLGEIFLLAVALAVSAVPEGLPVALTVALAVGMRRMARRNVIVRRLVAVEALGSCTAIASDKTGTLTVNELTVRTVVLPNGRSWEVTGEGTRPEGELRPTADADADVDADGDTALIQRLCRAASLTNDGFIGQRDGRWIHTGDPVDVALLVMAHKGGLIQSALLKDWPQIDAIPFEASYRLTANLNRRDGASWASAKGALESLLPLCDAMATEKGDVPLDHARVEKQMIALAEAGFRVLALADGSITLPDGKALGVDDLEHLTLLGLVGMIDPLRPETEAAVARCRNAGIQVSMVTGDHPGTALAIARELGMASSSRQVVTGFKLREAKTAGEDQLDRLTREARVFARVEPEQKLDIVHSMQRNGHFVAVTGDGANDAPALRAAQVGVAMGKNGTDVARETADLILADDNFASIVGGVEEGRVAYANVRKVIFLLISTGAAELVLFTLSLIANLPLPLVAVQLLWLNLVTNGIQDVALALEPAEGGELDRAPRPPREPVFNRLMIERVVTTALVMGVLAFLVFQHLLYSGQTVEQARNGTLLLMVLFENVQAFNSRSESRSVFFHNPLRNPALLFGTLIAQLIHIGAMYVPWLNDVLGVAPVSLREWGALFGVALIILVVMEMDKLLWRLISHFGQDRAKPKST